jgi:hypothetical protein
VSGVAGIPDSVDAMHGAHFGELVRAPWAVALTGSAALAGGLVVGVAATPMLGVLAAVGLVLAALALGLFVARRQAHRDFFGAFARQRGLELVEEGLPEVTPLLYAGSERVTTLAMRGGLGGGFTGTVAHYTYFERIATGGDGGGGGGGGVSRTAYKLTVVLIDVPGTQEAFPKLLCHGRHGSERTDKLDDALRDKSRKRLRLESTPFNRRFEVFFDPLDDEVRLRRLFSPTFIVWMAESMPSAFELVNENLCCFVGDHIDSAAELDTLIAGGVELAHRLQAEAVE